MVIGSRKNRRRRRVSFRSWVGVPSCPSWAASLAAPLPSSWEVPRPSLVVPPSPAVPSSACACPVAPFPSGPLVLPWVHPVPYPSDLPGPLDPWVPLVHLDPSPLVLRVPLVPQVPLVHQDPSVLPWVRLVPFVGAWADRPCLLGAGQRCSSRPSCRT